MTADVAQLIWPHQRYTRQTDRQTDGRTDNIWWHYPRITLLHAWHV